MNIRVLQRQRDEATIGVRLAKLGLSNDLGNLAKQDYSEEVIDGLIELLSEVRDPIMKLSVVKALCGPYKKAYKRVEKALISEYIEGAKSPDLIGMDSLLWGIGNCLEIIAAPAFSSVDTYISIAAEKKYGTSRQMIVLALSKFEKSKVEDALIDLLDDEDVAGHAVMALGRIKSVKALPRLVAVESSPKAWVKREARKSIRAIEKAIYNNGGGLTS